jgi:hypothetical protein
VPFHGVGHLWADARRPERSSRPAPATIVATKPAVPVGAPQQQAIDDIRVKRRGNGYPGRVDLPMDELGSAARGAAAGVVATAVMSVVMEAGRRAAPFRRQPPKLIIRTVLAGGPERAVPAEGPLAVAAHVGYGASCGVLFALSPGATGAQHHPAGGRIRAPAVVGQLRGMGSCCGRHGPPAAR